MKVFLAGEGANELGDWASHPTYRASVELTEEQRAELARDFAE